MRNHEMVYFFYEQAPKYNRDKYHKRIHAKNTTINNVKGDITNAGNPEGASNFSNGKNGKFFEPPNPVSVVEEDKWIKEVGKNGHGWDKHKPEYGKTFDPPNPASVLEEEKCLYGFNKKDKQNYAVKDLGKNHHFNPPNPASVLEEMDEFGMKKKYKGLPNQFEPVNPVSVLEEDEPKSMFESTKVFIGKRNHQTEKPQDILEFFLKYWTDEGETILDPTMGSGSTGVACKKLNRKFIGFELDETIFKKAVDRVEK